jgi:hypothetical protein
LIIQTHYNATFGRGGVTITKTKDEPRIEIVCETNELMERVIDQEKNSDSRNVSVHSSESVLSAIKDEGQLLIELMSEIAQKAFPSGKYSSLLRKSSTGENQATDRFHMFSDFPYDVIISFLRKSMGRNAWNLTTVDITARIGEFKTTDCLLSMSRAGQCISDDVKNMRVLPK